MDGAKYRAILEENWFWSAMYLSLGQKSTLQQGNNLKHTTKATLKCFKTKNLIVSK